MHFILKTFIRIEKYCLTAIRKTNIKFIFSIFRHHIKRLWHLLPNNIAYIKHIHTNGTICKYSVKMGSQFAVRSLYSFRIAS